MVEQENDQVRQRKQHLSEIVELGHVAYPHRFDRTHSISQIVGRYGSYAGVKAAEESEKVNAQLKTAEGGQLRMAGRVMTNRLMGKAAFSHISDGEGQIQLYFRKNDLGDQGWALYQRLDLGDWIGVRDSSSSPEPVSFRCTSRLSSSWPRHCCRCRTSFTGSMTRSSGTVSVMSI